MHFPPWPAAGERETELLQAVLNGAQWGGFHPFVSQFEQAFASYQQSRHGISAFNGTVTLELALTVLGVQPGDEVILPAVSFVSTATAVSRAGAVPVFVDIEAESFNIDPDAVRAALSPRTRGVLAVHFGGAMCRIDELEAICREHGIWLLEDAAHAHGSEWNGRRAGSFGIAGSFSFQNGKVLSSGEGGMLVTSDDDFAQVARSVANQGRAVGRSFYEHHRLGSNFRLGGFQAAVLLAQLERLPWQIETRTRNAKLLKATLDGVAGLVWQSMPAQITGSSYYLLPGRVSAGRGERDRLVGSLADAGVPCSPFYPHLLYENPLYRNGGAACRVLPCPNGLACVGDAFWLSHRVLLAGPETVVAVARRIEETMARVLT